MWKSVGVLLIVILFIDTAVITVSFIRQSNTLTEAGENATALESQINSLNGELLTLRGNIAGLQSKLADSENKAATLQTKLKAAEANATELQATLAYTNTQYARALAGPAPNVTLAPIREPLGPFDYGAGMGAP